MKYTNKKRWIALLLAGALVTAGTGSVSAAESAEPLPMETQDPEGNSTEISAGDSTENTADIPVTALAENTEEPEEPEEPEAADEAEEDLEAVEEELQEQNTTGPDVINAYITTEMDYGAEVAEGFSYGDGLLLRASPGASYIPDLDSWIPVRRQQPYGNCWAYAVMALAEAYQLRTGRAGNTVDYSELALAYSLFHTPEDPLGGTAGDHANVLVGNYLNVGANSFWGLETLSQWWGPLAEGAMTIGASGISPAQPTAEFLRSDALHLENFYMINIKANPKMAKEMIMQYGAVAGAYWDPSKDDGISRVDYYIDETNAFFYGNNKVKPQNHAITIVGWDDTFAKENFPTVTNAEGKEVEVGNDGAWLVRNSWGGTGYTYDSYFWMSYEEPSLAETVYAADFAAADKYANNYQYDGSVSNVNVANGTVTLQAANVFTTHASAAEYIEAVSVGIGSANTTAKVDVYTKLKDPKDPTSGTKAASGTCNLTFTGQYTIPLDKKAKVHQGDTFSVVVTLTNNSKKVSEAKIMRETDNLVDGQAQITASIKAGQSFVYNGSGWADQVSGGGNLRIKAFTNNTTPDPTPTPTPTPEPEKTPSVLYQTHVQTYGWQDWVADGTTSGTTGQSKRLEGIRIQVQNNERLGIQYRTHVQTYGWENGWSANGAVSGTTGESKRLEAIRIKLTGTDAEKYDVYYCVHAQQFGWLGWAKNGESAGTAGYSYRLEGIQIRIVKKGSAAPAPLGSRWVEFYEKGKDPQPAKNHTAALAAYNTHVQTYGWQEYVYDGDMAGTTGQSKRLEGIHIQLLNQKYGGNIEYRTHIQTYGWEPAWKTNGAMSGTSGQSKRLEAIQIRLTGEMAEKYDVWYQTHIQKFGWSGWAKNGEECGSAGYSYRLEGIRIRLLPKGNEAPGSTANRFYSK